VSAAAALPPVLDVRSLSVSYATRSGSVQALRDVSFAIRPSETLALVGESGSGKSTVALAVMGLLGHEATVHRGAIAFNGRDLRTLGAAQWQSLRGNALSVVFQDPFTSLNPSIPVGLQVAEPLVMHGRCARPKALETAIATLAEVGLPNAAEVAHAYPHQLSGGMQQRALIATALICDPALMILDEPTTALDVTVEAEIVDLLDELRRRRSLAMLFITHNLGLVNRICDSVCVLYAGSVLEQGPTADVLARPAHPYTQGLLASMPRLDRAGRRARLVPIAGKFPDLTALPPGCVFAPRCRHAEPRCNDAQTLERIETGRSVRCWKFRAVAGVAAHATIERAALRVSAAAQPLLAVDGLRKTYSQGVHAVRSHVELPLLGVRLPWARLARRVVRAVNGVSLEIRPAETLGLVGESGCGKSTLGRCVVRLLDPTAGTIVFDGRDVSREKSARLRAFRGHAQIVFQNPISSLNPRKTVGAAVGRSLANFSEAPAAQRRERVARILEQVGLAPSYAERYPHQLSGGERQRVGIARALATGPRFIVCDEPVSALDLSVQATVLNKLADLRDELGLAYLFISHDLSVVVHIADRIAVMYAGQICEQGPTDAVLAPPYHPYTEMLLAAIPSPDPGVVRRKRARARADLALTGKPASGCCFHHRCARKIGAICEEVAPPIVVAAPGHTIACHLPLATLSAVPEVMAVDDVASAGSAR
jgi:peptide/nickel transport system ATP-binding protein